MEAITLYKSKRTTFHLEKSPYNIFLMDWESISFFKKWYEEKFPTYCKLVDSFLVVENLDSYELIIFYNILGMKVKKDKTEHFNYLSVVYEIYEKIIKNQSK